MKKKEKYKFLILLLFPILITFNLKAQSQDNSTKNKIINKLKEFKFKITGDAYYRYDISDKSQNLSGRYSNYAPEHNTFGVGMADLELSNSFGKVDFFLEVAVGPRTFNTSPLGNLQQLYLDLNLSKKFKLTAGYMVTYFEHEYINPSLNFHYTSSTTFFNGPFQAAGLKLNYEIIKDKLSMMLGYFNNWKTVIAHNNFTDLGYMVQYQPIKNFSFRTNFNYNIFNSQLTYEFILNFLQTKIFNYTFKFFNYRDYSSSLSNGEGFFSFVNYFKLNFTDNSKLGLRYEHFFADKSSKIFYNKDVYLNGTYENSYNNSLNTVTLSYNYNFYGLRIIPEIEYSNSSEKIFKDINNNPTRDNLEFVIGLVYSIDNH